MATDNALVDPVSHPDADPADDGAKAGSHHAAPPANNGVNGTPPNLAGADQGPGGASTPFTAGGGGSGGSGAGPYI
jgi:hypothetical protein